MRFVYKPLLVVLLALRCLRGQAVDASRMGEPVNLGGDWLFHSGDDPAWSRPDLPDANWRVLSTNVGWFEHRKLWNGFYWYRLHVRIPAQHSRLALLFDYMGNPYEAFVNGTQLGRFGEFPPDEKVLRPLPRMFAVPPRAVSGDSIVIAIRFWTPPLLGGGWGGLRTSRPVVIGPEDAVSNEYARLQSEILYPWLPDICIGFVSVLLATALIVLYRLQPNSREYLWIASYLIVITGWNLFSDVQTIVPVRQQAISILDVALVSLAGVLLLQFIFAFLRRPMPLWLRIYQISLPLQTVLPVIDLYMGNARVDAIADGIAVLWNAPYVFILPGFALWRYLHGHREAGMLVIPLLLITFNSMLNDIGDLLFELNLRGDESDVIPPLNAGLVPIYAGQIGGLLFVVSIGGLLMYRFHATSERQARAQSELEAARSMQETMVPRNLREAAGFYIESVYIPAQEVGGDFFQLFPFQDSLLVVVGDVSGKGIKSAMLVGVIVGILQRTIRLTTSPARVLSDLNRCLAGQMDGKFATCCCALMHRDGRAIAANAGHLSPYCDGIEMGLPAGLPLGLDGDAEYEEVVFRVGPGQRWLFISDGVVEARSKSGELYGFERTRSASILTVNQIAETIQRFGPADDITVLGVTREAVGFA